MIDTIVKYQQPMHMFLVMENKEAEDLANNCSIGGWTIHIDAKHYFYGYWREKVFFESNILKVMITMQIFSHTEPTFKKHVKMHCGIDKYC